MTYSAQLQTTLTRWSGQTNDGFGGISFSSKSEILGRIQSDTNNYIDDAGEEFQSKAIVYTTIQLSINDWIYKGTSVQTNPQIQNGAYRVRQIYTTQNPSGSIIVYKAILG